VDGVEKFSVKRFTEQGQEDIEEVVVREFPLTIILNNRELVTLLCSPTDLKYLAIGFLASEGFVRHKDDLKKILVDDRRGVVRVETKEDPGISDEQVFKRFITSGCGKGTTFYRASDVQDQIKIESQIEISVSEVLDLSKNFLRHSQVYQVTGGVHSAALCDPKGMRVFAEDVGRHNAIDKIFGQCLLEEIAPDNHIILSSGRISSEMLLKVAKRNIPVVVSKSAPTALGVKLANELGITLIGFIRGKKMNVYANDWRIVTVRHGCL
jgi:FdhD protein